MNLPRIPECWCRAVSLPTLVEHLDLPVLVLVVTLPMLVEHLNLPVPALVVSLPMLVEHLDLPMLVQTTMAKENEGFRCREVLSA